MRRISSSGATGDGRFKETPSPATKLDAGFLNMLLDELVTVVTDPRGGNLALDPGDNTQLLQALIATVGRALPVSINVGAKTVNLGGFIVKLGSNLGSYGEATVYTAFAPPFPNACWGAFPLVRNDTQGIPRDIWPQGVGAPTVNGFYTRLNLGSGHNGESITIDGFDWVAFGI